MKSPEYVYAVTKTYRTLLDEGRVPTPQEMSSLSAVFSRSGFSDGYYVGGKGKNMFGIRKESDKEKTRDITLSVPPVPEKTVDVWGFFGGEQTFVTAVSGEYSYTAVGSSLPATGGGTEKDELIKRLAKTGGSGFKIGDITVEAEEGIFMPASLVNALRRDALAGLKAEILKANMPADSAKSFDIKKEPLLFLPVKGDIYRIYDIENGFNIPSNAARIDIPVWQIEAERFPKEKADIISVVLPRVITSAEEGDIRTLLNKAREMGIKRVTVSNIGHISLCGGFAVYGDHTLNVSNTRSARVYEEMGLSGICVSPEVTPYSVKTDIGEYPVYGRQVLMHTENCIIKNISGCVKDCKAVLTDRVGASFPVWGEYNHRNIIFNSVPTYLADKDIPHNRLFNITDEKTIPSEKPQEFTRGYWK